MESQKLKKICWVTADNFLQVDEPIMPFINNIYDLSWFIILPKQLSMTIDNEKRLKEFSQKNGINTELHFLSFRLRDLRIIKQYFKLFIQIRNLNPDLIYCNALYYPYFYIVLLLLLGREKVVYAEHDVVDHYKMKNRLIMQLYKKFIFNIFKNFQIFSKNQLDIFIKMHPNKNVFMAPLAMSDYGDSVVIPNKSVINFLFFGSIRENKGLSYLIKAGNKLAFQHKDSFIITIAGKADNWEKYGKLIESKAIFKTIIREIHNNEIPDLFNSAHYLVLPYIDITQSGPMMIALNYNVPIIASDLPGFREYIENDVNGYLFNSKNVDSLSNVMEKSINLFSSNYISLKNNQKIFTKENVSIESIVQLYVNFFKTIIK
jgi:glycosyltransferase involved in cell wall biosynthesis